MQKLLEEKPLVELMRWRGGGVGGAHVRDVISSGGFKDAD